MSIQLIPPLEKIFIFNIIQEKTSDLLETINSHYPKEFNKKQLEKIKLKIIKNIKFTRTSSEKYIKKRKPIRKPRIELDDNARCIARKWNPKDINGSRCSLRKQNECNYCHIHKNNNIHGNWGEPLTEALKMNFKKHNKLKTITTN